jgi:hypothetical protein
VWFIGEIGNIVVEPHRQLGILSELFYPQFLLLGQAYLIQKNNPTVPVWFIGAIGHIVVEPHRQLGVLSELFYLQFLLLGQAHFEQVIKLAILSKKILLCLCGSNLCSLSPYLHYKFATIFSNSPSAIATFSRADYAKKQLAMVDGRL